MIGSALTGNARKVGEVKYERITRMHDSCFYSSNAYFACFMGYIHETEVIGGTGVPGQGVPGVMQTGGHDGTDLSHAGAGED